MSLVRWELVCEGTGTKGQFFCGPVGATESKAKTLSTQAQARVFKINLVNTQDTVPPSRRVNPFKECIVIDTRNGFTNEKHVLGNTGAAGAAKSICKSSDQNQWFFSDPAGRCLLSTPPL